MTKGMFYLLPFLVLTPVVASKALPQVEVAHLLNVLEREKAVEVPKVVIMSPKPISGRNILRPRVKVSKPRAGRNNASRLRKRGLIRRQ